MAFEKKTHLCNFDVETLTHFTPWLMDANAPIRINIHKRNKLLCLPRCNKFHRYNGYSPFHKLVFRIEFFGYLRTTLIAAWFLGDISTACIRKNEYGNYESELLVTSNMINSQNFVWKPTLLDMIYKSNSLAVVLEYFLDIFLNQGMSRIMCAFSQPCKWYLV